MTHSYVWRDLFIRVIRLCHTRELTHWVRDRWLGEFVRIARKRTIQLILSVIRVTWLIYMWLSMYTMAVRVAWLVHTCEVTHLHAWNESFICVTWLIHTCEVTHSYVWRDSFICVTWLIHMCDMTHSCVWCDSSISVTTLPHTSDMTRSFAWHDFTCVTWLMCWRTHVWVVVHMNESRHTYEWMSHATLCTNELYVARVTHINEFRVTWLTC